MNKRGLFKNLMLLLNLCLIPQTHVLLAGQKLKSYNRKGNGVHAKKSFGMFGGGGCPQIDLSFCTFHSPNTIILIHHKIDSLTAFKNFIPLSTRCVDYKFHDIKITNDMVGVIAKAMGWDGLFTSQNRLRHIGSCAYIQERSDRSQSITCPSEGPRLHGRWYYCQYIDHVYWPFVLHLYNHHGKAAS